VGDGAATPTSNGVLSLVTAIVTLPARGHSTERETDHMHVSTARRRGLVCLALALAVPMAGVAVSAPAGADGTTGTVSGTAYLAATGKPMKNVCVNVVEASSNTTVGTSGPSSSKGVWSLAGVPPSSDYTAIASDCKGGDYVPQWYSNQDFQSSATQFAVTAGGTTTGIDFSLTMGGAIAGKVTDAATKKPVAGILVIAYWTTAYQVAGAACTAANGKYKIPGIDTTGTKVEFVPGDCGVTSTYSVSWYGGSDYSSGTYVPITAKKTTGNINQAMS
jgi:hypothetical protein